MDDDKIKAAIERMQKKCKEYNEGANCANYEECCILQAGKAVGMEEALEILKDVME